MTASVFLSAVRLSIAAAYGVPGGLLTWLTMAAPASGAADPAKPAPIIEFRRTAVPPMFTARALRSPALDGVMGPSLRGDAPRLAEILGATDSPATTVLPNACKKDSSVVCYDPKGGRAVFPFTKSLMPEIQGLQADNIAVKRDRVTFSYTFR